MKLYDVKGAAEMLAISPWTVRAFIRDGKLRPIKVGRLVRLEQEELERFVGDSRVSPTQDRILKEQQR